jgi:hypothetical protein
MVYTKKSPALFIIGVVMLAIWALAYTDVIAPYIEHLANGKKYKYASELTSIPLYFGIVAVVFGLWQWFGKHKQGHWDYYSSTVAGGMFILLIAMLVRWFIAPEVAVASTAMGKVGETGKYIHKLLGLNYVVIGIVAGIVVVNVFSIPKWAENGVRLSRL